jgi:integrase
MASKKKRGGNSTKPSSKHPGVSLIERPTGWVARWRDPETKANLSQSLRGYTKAERIEFAKQQSIELQQAKLDNRAGTYFQKKQERIEAERAAELEAHGAAGTPIDEAIDTYNETLTPTSQKGRKCLHRAFKDWCQDNGVVGTKELTDDVLLAFSAKLRKDMSAGKRAVSTTRTWLAYLSAFVCDLPKSAIDPVLLDRTPSELKKTLKKPAREDTESVVMQPKQAQAVLAAVHAYDTAPSWQEDRKGDYGPFVLAMLLGGFRPGELRSLTFDMVHDSFVQVTADMSKTNKARRVTFEEAPALRRLLVAMRDAAGDPEGGTLVFPNKTGWQDAKDNRLTKEFGLDSAFMLKHCRSTADTVLLYTPGINVTEFQIERRHGHSGEVIREHYAGELRPVDKDATSIEAALGIEDIADEIIGRVRQGALGDQADVA